MPASEPAKTFTAKQIREARRAFKDLRPAKQQEFLEELITTQSALLHTAYPTLERIFAGSKVRHRKDGSVRVLREPCVVLVIRNKWKPDRKGPRPNPLPTHLFGFRTVARQRVLLAVRTDVDEAREYQRVRLEAAPRGIRVLPAGNLPAELGSVPVAIRRSVARNRLYAISCRHVLGVTRRTYPQERPGLGVTVRPAGSAAVGRTLAVRGRLRNEPGFSMDAQVLRAEDADALAAAMGSVRYGAVARSPRDIPPAARVVIFTPRGQIRARYRTTVTGFPVLDYGHPDISRVIHRQLIQSVLGSEVTQGGDSGSAVVAAIGDGLLLGMHMGRSNEHAYAIPAWLILDPRNYLRTRRDERWRPLPPPAGA